MLKSKILTSDAILFREGFQPVLHNIFESYYTITNPNLESVILAVDNIIKHKIFYNEEWCFYKDIEDDLRDGTVSEIGAMVAREYGAKLIGYITTENPFSFRPRLNPVDSETKSYDGTDTKEFTHGKKTKDSGESYSVGEDAPINSVINEINTPSGKNKSEYSNERTNSGVDTDKNTMDYSITTTRENFDYMERYLDHYLKNGNELYNMLESEINKFIVDKIIMF